MVAKATRDAGGRFSSKTWVLVAAVLGSSIVFLDGTVVNVALPRIGRDLPRAFVGVLEGQSYIYNGYLLSLSALLILAGALNDFYGRKRMFIVRGLRADDQPEGFLPLAQSVQQVVQKLTILRLRKFVIDELDDLFVRFQVLPNLLSLSLYAVGLDKILCVSPVSFGVEVANIQAILRT